MAFHPICSKMNVEVENKKKTEEIVKTDISKLSKRQKIDLLLKESPEFFGLVEDFKSKMALARDFLAPTIALSKNNKVSNCKALDFVKTHYEIILNYCTNISMYLLLKASRVNVQNHPVVKRLYQYRQLLAQLDPEKEYTKHEEVDQSDKEENISEERNTEITTDGASRRGITYQIAKNKGLTPHRNRLQRNPRVKHRNKYRKAKIRRKGAVREVRTELSRYAGELSGIKASVTKSIKIKS